jgi:hypothetical protein
MKNFSKSLLRVRYPRVECRADMVREIPRRFPALFQFPDPQQCNLVTLSV